jgi:4-hydroxy-tetrahydrodipicolinate synthase
LLAGCGSNSTSHAVFLAKCAAAQGADALLAVTPYYNKASDLGLLRHYRAIADATDCPLILYNIPSRTGYHLSMPLYRELAKHENIVAVKEASGDLGLLEALCDECGDRLDVYTGNDHQLVTAMKLGAQGVISVASNLFPREVIEIFRLCATQEYRMAGHRMRAILPMMQALFCEVNPIPVKYVAALRGLCEPEYRLPLCPPSPESAKRLQEIFRQ